MCDGSEISRTTYARLFAVIGTTYGSGDSSTTFNLPDCREVALVGIGENTTNTIANHDTYALGEFKDDQLQNHTHGFSATWGNISYTFAGGGNGATIGNITGLTTGGSNGRVGNTTRGKRLGVNYIIKYQ